MSNIKRGYPNPNYTEEDILTGKVTEENFLELDPGLVTVEADHYEELVSKAAALDILTSCIQITGKVDDEIVKAVTGTIAKVEMVPKTEVDEVWGYYHNKISEIDKLKQEIASLTRANGELKEILRQNKIGPYADQPEEDKEDNHGEA